MRFTRPGRRARPSATTSCAPCSSAASGARDGAVLADIVVDEVDDRPRALQRPELRHARRRARARLPGHQVINFAHGEIGAFGAAVLGILVVDHHWNFFLALLVALVVGGAVGAARRGPRRAPPVPPAPVRAPDRHDRRVADPVLRPGGAAVGRPARAVPDADRPRRSPSTSSSCAASTSWCSPSSRPPIAGLALFLNRNPHGLAIKACAENADAAQLGGISIRRVSTFVWVLAGVLATLTAVLVNPLKGAVVGVPSIALGPGPAPPGARSPCSSAGSCRCRGCSPAASPSGIVEALLFTNVQNPGHAPTWSCCSSPSPSCSGGASPWPSTTAAAGSTPRPARRDRRRRRGRGRRRLVVGAAVAFGVVLPLVASSRRRRSCSRGC